MARRKTYIITRNGEHQVGNFSSRKVAESKIKLLKANDVRMAQLGWITVHQMELTRYNIEVH